VCVDLSISIGSVVASYEVIDKYREKETHRCDSDSRKKRDTFIYPQIVIELEGKIKRYTPSEQREQGAQIACICLLKRTNISVKAITWRNAERRRTIKRKNN